MEPNCRVCQLPKASLRCGLCEQAVCQKCAEFLPEGAFSFLKNPPPELGHEVYCGPCFTDKVAGPLADYRRTLSRAKALIVYERGQSQETRMMKRSAKPIQVEGCADRPETLLRLAFFAVQAGYNAIIDVQINSKKVRNFGYQNMMWAGTAIPTHVDVEKLEREAKPGKVLLPRPSA